MLDGYQGSSNSHTVTLERLICPVCKIDRDWFPSYDGTPYCFNCKNSFVTESISKENKQYKAVICNKCGDTKPLVDEAKYHNTFVCSSCSNSLLVFYGKTLHQPESVMGIGWSRGVNKHSVHIEDGLAVWTPQTKKELFAIELFTEMHSEAKEGSITSFKPKTQEIIVLHDQKSFICFLIWTGPGQGRSKTALRVLYTVPECRNKGYAAILVKYWMEQIVPQQSSSDAIGIESPTPATARILQRLGYLKENYPVKIFEFLGM